MTKANLKQEILDRVTDFYLSSHDFNGMPGSSLLENHAVEEIAEAIQGLIMDQSLVLMHRDFDVNVHILRVGIPKIEYQLEKAKEFSKACLYPAPSSLKERAKDLYANEPYKKELALGNPQLSYKSFDLSILEVYRNDPRYRYTNDDISGSISYEADDFSFDEENKDQILLQTFGFSYDEDFNRAVAVFLRYLADLSPEHQNLWRAREVSGDYKLHPDYYDNTILGEWGRKMGLLEAFLLELKVINDMALAINGVAFFYADFDEARPREFSFLVRPTLKEFNEFVLLLDKMISENINREFFRNLVPLESEETRSDGKTIVKQKGTIFLLEEWLRNSFRVQDKRPLEEMIDTFKKIRKMRQKPAHKIDENRFDQMYFKEQRDLILKAYEAIRLLRLVFANHPNARGIEVPDLLFRGEIWPM